MSILVALCLLVGTEVQAATGTLVSTFSRSNFTIMSTSADSTLHAISTFPFDDDEDTIDYFTVASDEQGSPVSKSCGCTSSEGAQFLSPLQNEWASSITLPSVRTSELFELAFKSCHAVADNSNTNADERRLSDWQPLISFNTNTRRYDTRRADWGAPITSNKSIIRLDEKLGPFFARVVNQSTSTEYTDGIDGVLSTRYLSMVDAVRFGPCSNTNITNHTQWMPDVVEYKHNINMDLLHSHCNQCVSGENVHQKTSANKETTRTMERTFHLFGHRHKMTKTQGWTAPMRTAHKIVTRRTHDRVHTSSTKKNIRSIAWDIDIDRDVHSSDSFGTPVSVNWYRPPLVEITDGINNKLSTRMIYSLVVEFEYSYDSIVVGPRIVKLPAMDKQYTCSGIRDCEMVYERRSMDRFEEYNISTVHLIPHHTDNYTTDSYMADVMPTAAARECHKLHVYSIRPEMRRSEYTDGIPFSAHYHNATDAMQNGIIDENCLAAVNRAIQNGLDPDQTISDCPEFRHAFCTLERCRYVLDFSTDDIDVSTQSSDDSVHSIDPNVFRRCWNKPDDNSSDHDYSFQLRAQRCEFQPDTLIAKDDTCRYQQYKDQNNVQPSDLDRTPDFMKVTVTVDQTIPSASIHTPTYHHQDAAIGLILTSPLVPYFHGGLFGEQSVCNDTSGVLWPADVDPLDHPELNSSWGHEIKRTTGSEGLDLVAEVAKFRLLQACEQTKGAGILTDTDYQVCLDVKTFSSKFPPTFFDPPNMCKWETPHDEIPIVDVAVLAVRNRFTSWTLPERATYIDPETIKITITLPAIAELKEQVIEISNQTVHSCRSGTYTHGTYTRILSTFFPVQPVLMYRGRDINNNEYLKCSVSETENEPCATLQSTKNGRSMLATAGPDGVTLPFAHNNKLFGMDGMGFNLIVMLDDLYIRYMRGGFNGAGSQTRDQTCRIGPNYNYSPDVLQEIILLRHLTQLLNADAAITIDVAFNTLLMYDTDATTGRRLLQKSSSTSDVNEVQLSHNIQLSNEHVRQMENTMQHKSASGSFPVIPVRSVPLAMAITTLVSVMLTFTP